MNEPFVVALCPTFRRPAMLSNSLALWERQTYPAHRRALLILDDGGTFDEQSGYNWTLWTAPRFDRLPAKFNAMWRNVPGYVDAFLVWEDDDCYLPDYVTRHAACLAEHELSKPRRVRSDYPGKIVTEPAAGRFHSTLGMRRELLERIGGWPETKRADFDQQVIASLHQHAASVGDPFAGLPGEQIPLIYRWHTGYHHGQSTMRSQDDETWYDRAADLHGPIWVGKLTPKLDAFSMEMLGE